MTGIAAVLAMLPGLEAELFEPPTAARLNAVVSMVSPEPVDLVRASLELLAPVQVVVGGWGCPPLDVAILDRLPNLRLVAYAAGSVKGVVTPETWSRGIAVSTAAGANAVPVAEFTFAAIVMIAKDVFRVRDQHRVARGTAGVAGRGPAGPVGTNGLRIGVVGASRIGRLVIDRLGSLDAEIAVYDPYVDAEAASELRATGMDLDELCAWADIVTVHAPELESTRHLLNADRLAAMRDGAWLINTARGSLVDTAALERECLSGRLSAFIDTPEPEPLPESSPMWDLPNVVLTPHIAGSMGNEIARMGEVAVDEVARFVHGEPLQHPVVARDLERMA
jgi:phosphoglycerate dehydrogenase-like enzyme